MKNIELSPRLAEAVKYIRKGSLVADIGTDHAFLPIFLVKNHVSSKVIATDIVDGPIAIARKNVSEFGCSESITIIKSFGLREIGDLFPEDVVIFGLGGETIVSILSECERIRQTGVRLILQPMTKAEVLREWLFKNGFRIENESLVREKSKIYQIMVACFFGEAIQYDYLDLCLGPVNKKNRTDDCLALVRRLLIENRKKVNGLRAGNLDFSKYETRIKTLEDYKLNDGN